jgi:hypothetical protein
VNESMSTLSLVAFALNLSFSSSFFLFDGLIERDLRREVQTRQNASKTRMITIDACWRLLQAVAFEVVTYKQPVVAAVAVVVVNKIVESVRSSTV